MGDKVKVHQKIIESGKERNYVFEGLVISIRGRGENQSFTVRRIAAGNIGVERIYPLASPWLNKIEVVRQGKVRRAKLFYLRKKVGRKAARIKIKKEKTGGKDTKATKTPKKVSQNGPSKEKKTGIKKGQGKKGRKTRHQTPDK